MSSMPEAILLTPEPSANGDLLNRVQQLRLDNQLGQGAKSRASGGTAWLPWVLCALLATSWALLGVRTYKYARPGEGGFATAGSSAGGQGGTQSGGPASSAPTPPPEAGTIQLEVKGYIVPAVQVAVSPIDVAGQIVELNVKEGDFYKQGTPLAKIDSSNYGYSVNEAQQALFSSREKLKSALQRRDEMLPAAVRAVEKDQLRAQIAEAKAQKDRTDDELRRTVDARNSFTAKEYVAAQQEASAAAARLEKLTIDLRILEEGPRKQKISAADAEVTGAEADIKAAEARLDQAQWKLRNCVIRAPISGTVLTKKSEKGNLVNPLAFAGSSGSVCDMADLADLEADLEIPERDISKLRVGQACRVRADAFPDKPYTGRLDRIMPIANRAKSIVNVRVKVKLPDGEAPGTFLKPEMGAVVSFLAGK